MDRIIASNLLKALLQLHLRIELHSTIYPNKDEFKNNLMDQY